MYFLELNIDGTYVGRTALNDPNLSLSGGGFEVNSALSLTTYTAENSTRDLAFGGSLLDMTGVALNGTFDITYSLFDTEIGGTLIWSEAYTSNIQDGQVSQKLGGSSPLPSSINPDMYFLELSVDGGALERISLNTPQYHFGDISDPESSAVLEPMPITMLGIGLLLMIRFKRNSPLFCNIS